MKITWKRAGDTSKITILLEIDMVDFAWARLTGLSKYGKLSDKLEVFRQVALAQEAATKREKPQLGDGNSAIQIQDALEDMMYKGKGIALELAEEVQKIAIPPVFANRKKQVNNK